jgi:hypothetical protein
VVEVRIVEYRPLPENVIVEINESYKSCTLEMSVGDGNKYDKQEI